MQIRLFFSTLALAVSFPVLAQEPVQQSAEQSVGDTVTTKEQSPFVGRYNGSSFETAMGMIIRADGTFQWGLSVGGLDLRAAGKWSVTGGVITFVSDPKPIAPEFRWTGTKEAAGAPLLIVQRPDGRHLEYVDVAIQCTGESQSYYQIPEGGLQIDLESCAEPIAFTLEMRGGIERDPQTFNLVDQGWRKGHTAIIEFHRNDLGVADFDGVTGQFVDGKLMVEGALGAMTLRKITPPTEKGFSN